MGQKLLSTLAFALLGAWITLIASGALADDDSESKVNAARKKLATPAVKPTPAPSPTTTVEEVEDRFEPNSLIVFYEPMHQSFTENLNVANPAGTGSSATSQSSASGGGFALGGLALQGRYNALEDISANLALEFSSRDVANQGALAGTSSSALELHARLDVDYSFYQVGGSELTGGLGFQFMRFPYYSAPAVDSPNLSVVSSTNLCVAGVGRYKRKIWPKTLTSATLTLGFPFLVSGSGSDSFSPNGGFLGTLMVEHKKNFGVKGMTFFTFGAGLTFETVSFTQSAPFIAAGSFTLFQEQLRAGVGMVL